MALNQGQQLKVTRDSCANVKLLKKLEQEGFIKIYEVMTENQTNSIKSKILPVAVYNHTKYNECVYGDENSSYGPIRETIGKQNIGDAIKLEAHIRNNHDYFVTEDTDFLNKRRELTEKFGITIVTPLELASICNNS